MSKSYQAMDPVIRKNRRDMFNKLRENKRNIFKQQFNQLLAMQSKRYTLDELSDILQRDRGTINNWKHGYSLPGQKTIEEIEQAFEVPGYFDRMDLFQRELANPDHHRQMNQEAARYGKQLGLSENFVRFLRDNPDISDRISYMQPTDAVLNSFDVRVPNMNMTYQFTNHNGERSYINPYMINVLRVLQSEVEEFIHKKLDEYEPIITEEYDKGASDILDETFPRGYFRRKVRKLNDQ